MPRHIKATEQTPSPTPTPLKPNQIQDQSQRGGGKEGRSCPSRDDRESSSPRGTRPPPPRRVSGAEISPESNPVPPAADIAGFCRKRRRSAAALTGQCWWRLETLEVRRPPFVVARGWWEARNTVQLAGRLLLAESADLLLLFWVLILR